METGTSGHEGAYYVGVRYDAHPEAVIAARGAG
jgi:hypothetical protein